MRVASRALPICAAAASARSPERSPTTALVAATVGGRDPRRSRTTTTSTRTRTSRRAARRGPPRPHHRRALGAPRRRPLRSQPAPFATGHYVGVLAKANTALRDRVDRILRERMRDGTLERIFASGASGTISQAAFSRGRSGERKGILDGEHRRRRALRATESRAELPRPSDIFSALRCLSCYLPAFSPNAALVTIALAASRWRSPFCVGVSIASGRIYGGALSRSILTAYVEITRGTPVLLQLFVLYYGLSSVDPPPCVRRRAPRSRPQLRRLRERDLSRRARGRPGGQLEAARTLGLTEVQVLRSFAGRRPSGSRSRR